MLFAPEHYTLDEESQTIWHNAQASNDKGPEVQAMVLAERDQNQDNEFSGIVEGEPDQKGDDDLEAQRVTGIAYATD
jgi:hypothetical protein